MKTQEQQRYEAAVEAVRDLLKMGGMPSRSAIAMAKAHGLDAEEARRAVAEARSR